MDRIRVVIGTNNAGKVREIREMYADLPITWTMMDEIGIAPTVAETGRTFRENAVLKADAVARWSGLPALAEDSGLEVDALDGAPGVYSARFSGPDASDFSNVALLLDRLDGVPSGKRTARFCAVAVVRWTDGALDEAAGACEGRIALSPAGSSGFGYDPVFIPEGEVRTFAELGQEVKNSMSHRARALGSLRTLLEIRLAETR